MVVMGFVVWNMTDNPAEAVIGSASGGTDIPSNQAILQAEEEARRARIESAILERREEILRFELQTLEEAYRYLRGSGDPEVEARYRSALAALVTLFQDTQQAEAALLQSFRQIWEAQGRAIAVARSLAGAVIPRLMWPVEPLYGISAGFLDAAYEERFGLPHRAVDIPVEQGSTILAAADGVVEEVNDNGLGFNSVTIRHDGFVTLYGHVESFLIEEGAAIHAGDPIALSGGMPGTPGAGHLSTGPHLHFELMVEGAHVDPMEYLPSEPLKL